jgi:hypothetical protein
VEGKRLPRVNPSFELPDAAGTLAAILKDLIIPYAFGGAIAQNCWETAGAIREIEVLVSVPGARFDELRNALKDAGFKIPGYEEGQRALRAAGLDLRVLRELRDLPEDQLQELTERVMTALAPVRVPRVRVSAHRGSYFELRKGLVRVELFYPSLPIHHSILRRAVKLPFGAGAVWVMSAEDLIVLKLVSGEEKDVLDARSILWTQRDRLDLGYVRSWAARQLDKERMAEVEAWIC